MLNISQIEAYYSYFYKKRYKVSTYSFRSTKTTKSVCESFLALVDKEYSLHCVGLDFLWDYFIFQFQYWEDAALDNKFSDKVVIGWIVGKKAFERWVKRDKQFDWQTSHGKFIDTYHLNRKEIPEQPASAAKRKHYDSSKAIRKQFLNTDKGFAICVQQTTLYDPSDLSCLKCNSKNDCKELLRVNFTKLYSKRIA